MSDFNDFKVPVYPNINDSPIAPTEQQAGNASDLIKRFNDLCDELKKQIIVLSEQSSVGVIKPKIVQGDYEAQPNEHILWINDIYTKTYTLPKTPQQGDYNTVLMRVGHTDSAKIFETNAIDGFITIYGGSIDNKWRAIAVQNESSYPESLGILSFYYVNQSWYCVNTHGLFISKYGEN